MIKRDHNPIEEKGEGKPVLLVVLKSRRKRELRLGNNSKTIIQLGNNRTKENYK